MIQLLKKKNAEYKNVKYIKNQMLPQHQKEFVSFIEWQIAQKIFDINGKYVSHEDLTFNIFFWNLYKINETALHWATRKGHSEVTKVLLEQKGFDINAKDKDEETALMNASSEGHTEIVKLLLEQEGIDINAKDKYEQTALIRASYEGYTEIVKLLLEQKGIDINAKNKYEKTALNLASLNDHTEIVGLIKKKLEIK